MVLLHLQTRFILHLHHQTISTRILRNLTSLNFLPYRFCQATSKRHWNLKTLSPSSTFSTSSKSTLSTSSTLSTFSTSSTYQIPGYQLHQNSLLKSQPPLSLPTLCITRSYCSRLKSSLSSLPASHSTRSYCDDRYPWETFDMADNKFAADYDKLGRASCKKCKQKCPKGELRIARVVPNFFHDGEGVMKQYHHPACIFETFIKCRATTKIIEGPDDVEGFADLKDEDKATIRQLIKETMEKKGAPKTKKAPAKKSPAAATAKSPAKSPAKPPAPKVVKQESVVAGTSKDPSPPPPPPPVEDDGPIPESRDFSTAKDKDNSLRQFRRLCADLADIGSSLEKTKIIKTFIQKGSTGEGYKGDLALLLKLLLPGEKGNKRVYNIHNKQIVKIFSQVFRASQDDMVEDLEQGDVAETVRIFFEKSTACPPHKKSILTLQDVDKYLDELAMYTKEDDQQRVLTKIARRCTGNDLKMVVRLIKHDLRINAGAKPILDALDPNAYEAFQASRDLKDVVERVQELRQSNKAGGMVKKLSIKACLMTPVLPMLAEACKSVEFAFKRCPSGMYAEIKYDGERVQVHKQGSQFSYFSRSLKPVLGHKVQHFKDWIPEAFPSGSDMILDSEVLLIDTTTGKPLPFGTLGVHKKAQFSDANVCLFVFDIIHYNGETLMDKPMRKRRSILREVMTEIPNRVMFSEMTHITQPPQLQQLMMKVFREGLEGLVLKDLDGAYEPGKRHWLKVKKDYLAEGAMADSADLVMLGAYYGTGNKGGIMSVFLMGCYDEDRKRWVTVTKCHCGFDDKTLEKLQKQLEPLVEKISQDKTRIPAWLHMNKAAVPDFVVIDPKKSPVWEITGAEFTKSDIHTADGISIRFPRMTKIRDDKDWTNHTNLNRLRELFKKSKETSDMPDFLGGGKGKKMAPISSQSSLESESDNSNNSAIKRKIKEEVKEEDVSPKKKTQEESLGGSSSEHKVKNGGSNGSNGSTNGALPDVFNGMSFYVPDGAEKAQLLKRYIVAFDGDVVEEFDKASASHVIVLNKEEAKDAKHVHIDWVWRCIRKKKIVAVS